MLRYPGLRAVLAKPVQRRPDLSTRAVDLVARATIILLKEERTLHGEIRCSRDYVSVIGSQFQHERQQIAQLRIGKIRPGHFATRTTPGRSFEMGHDPDRIVASA